MDAVYAVQAFGLGRPEAGNQFPSAHSKLPPDHPVKVRHRDIKPSANPPEGNTGVQINLLNIQQLFHYTVSIRNCIHIVSIL